MEEGRRQDLGHIFKHLLSRPSYHLTLSSSHSGGSSSIWSSRTNITSRPGFEGGAAPKIRLLLQRVGTCGTSSICKSLVVIGNSPGLIGKSRRLLLLRRL